MAEESIRRAAVGRIANIGDLYDAHSDDFCRMTIFKKTPPINAIRITDNPFSDTQFIYTDSYSDKFDKLDIKAELKLSILAGLCSLEGHGKFLRDEKKSARAVRSSLLYNIQTRVEQLNLFSEDLKDCFAYDAINKVTNATHVVVEVTWGANSMITMEYSNSENEDINEIRGALDAKLKKISYSISGKGDVDYGSSEKKKDKSFSLRIFADVLPTNEDIPQTFDEALLLMKKMPSLVQSANEGKGKPLQYVLVPLSELKKYFNLEQITDRFTKQLNEQSIIRFVQIYDDVSIVRQQLNDLFNDMNSHRFCVQNEDIKLVGKTKTELEAAEVNLRSNLAKTLVEVRSGKAEASQLDLIRSDFESENFSLEKVKVVIDSFHNEVEKIRFTDFLTKKGVAYIGLGASIETEQMKNSTGDIYVLFFGNKFKNSNPQLYKDNRHQFLSLINEFNNDSIDGQMMANQTTKTTFIAVDCDVRPEVAAEEGIQDDRIRICHYRNGKYISHDVLGSQFDSLREAAKLEMKNKSEMKEKKSKMLAQNKIKHRLSEKKFELTQCISSYLEDIEGMVNKTCSTKEYAEGCLVNDASSFSWWMAKAVLTVGIGHVVSYKDLKSRVLNFITDLESFETKQKSIANEFSTTIKEAFSIANELIECLDELEDGDLKNSSTLSVGRNVKIVMLDTSSHVRAFKEGYKKLCVAEEAVANSLQLIEALKSEKKYNESLLARINLWNA